MGIIVSAVGMFYVRAGRRDHEPVRLLCGAGMAIAPWLFTSVLVLIVVVVVLAFLPAALERFG